MKGLFRMSLWLNGIPLSKANRELARLHALDKESFENEIIKRRDNIVKWHLENNDFYSKLVSNRWDGRFEDLPIVRKRDFQDGLENIISRSFKVKDLHTGATSGSSGHPFYYGKDKFCHAMTWALISDRYLSRGIRTDDKQARFFGIPLKGKARIIEKIKDFLANRVRFHVFDISDKQLDKYLNAFKNSRFVYLYGYTSPLVVFAKYLIKRNIILSNVCTSLKCCIVTSEVCTPEDKTTLEKGFGVNVINEYGASETDIMAFTDENDQWILSDENDYFEVVDAHGNVLENGKEGRILVTSLYNKAMPIIRYEIGDMGIIDRINGKHVLVKLAGRVNDIVKLPSGKCSAGLTFYYVAKSVLEKTDVIKEFIIRQIALDKFVFDIVSDRDITKEEIEIMESKMDIYLEKGLTLTINRVEKIDRPKSGKIKHFYSEI